MFIKQVYYFEIRYLKIIKILVKKMKKKHNNLNRIWFMLPLNMFISKKSVNSRMGKGKGKFARSMVRLKKYAKILEFKGYKNVSLGKLNKLVYKKTSLKLTLLSKTTVLPNEIYTYYSKKYFVL